MVSLYSARDRSVRPRQASAYLRRLLTSIARRRVKSRNDGNIIGRIAGALLVKWNLVHAQRSGVYKHTERDEEERKERDIMVREFLNALLTIVDTLSTHDILIVSLPLVVAILTKFWPALHGKSSLYKTLLGAACNNKKLVRSATLSLSSKKSKYDRGMDIKASSVGANTVQLPLPKAPVMPVRRRRWQRALLLSNEVMRKV